MIIEGKTRIPKSRGRVPKVHVKDKKTVVQSEAEDLCATSEPPIGSEKEEYFLCRIEVSDSPHDTSDICRDTPDQ